MNDLRTIQNWMQSALISRGDLSEKLELAKQKTGLSLDDLIHSKKGVSAYERFDIYASGYVLRLLECMRADFPKLQLFLGEELFDTFAKAYIVTIPSSSWNLYDLGAKFANFLKESEPKGNELFTIPAQLAQIERMQVEAMQSFGIENTPQKESVDFFNIFTENIILEKVETLRLINQSYDLYEFFFNIEPLSSCEIPPKEDTYLSVSRKNYRVQINKIEKWQYFFLESSKEKISLNSAIETTSNKINISPSTLRAKLVFWLPLAFEMGFLKMVNST